MVIPKSVVEIASSPFYGCAELESIVVEDGNELYDSRDNCNALIETKSNTLLNGCYNTTIPNTVTAIGGLAFYECKKLK